MVRGAARRRSRCRYRNSRPRRARQPDPPASMRTRQSRVPPLGADRAAVPNPATPPTRPSDRCGAAESTRSRSSQPARAGRQGQRLSVRACRRWSANFVQVGAGRQPHRRHVLHPEARQGTVRIQSAEPDRRRRRRSARWWCATASSRPRISIRCRRRRCASCCPTASICCKDTNVVGGLRRRRLRHRRDRGKADVWSAPTG